MKNSNSIYSFSLGAIIANIGFPIENLTQTDFILLLIFICKTMLAGFLSVLSTDLFKKVKTWLTKFFNKNGK